ncbi:lytic transglycosylase domain-containing protein [Dechloromonas sp. HYN0024]|uniref:lytic transglycosylase domain-containing protein n=1 Tax=Dechloromonas sp. HYN0024 TaxID=2231055 RepID=UPI001F074D66|nr:lytic transglycosylase domain-containing protein [Dechloromonas sp. HYN0024]
MSAPLTSGQVWAGANADPAPYRLKLATPEVYRMQLPATAATTVLPHDTSVREAAAREHLDAELLHAVMATESGHQANAVSPAGAIGLMQLMPATAKRFGVINPLSPSENIKGGAAYLRQLLNRFDQDLNLALAAYNAGEGTVEAHGRKIPPFAETRRYVPAVTSRYRELKKESNPYRLDQARAPLPELPVAGVKHPDPEQKISHPMGYDRRP